MCLFSRNIITETVRVRSCYHRTEFDQFPQHSLKVQFIKFLTNTQIPYSKVDSSRLRSNLILVTFLKPPILNFPSVSELFEYMLGLKYLRTSSKVYTSLYE